MTLTRLLLIAVILLFAYLIFSGQDDDGEREPDVTNVYKLTSCGSSI